MTRKRIEKVKPSARPKTYGFPSVDYFPKTQESESLSHVGELGHDGISDQTNNRLDDIGCRESRVLLEGTRGICIVDLGRVLEEQDDKGGCKKTVEFLSLRYDE